MHPGAQAEPVLCAWGINTDGKPVLVGLAAASSESTDAWDDFLTDLKARGFRSPLLVIIDGDPSCWPPSSCISVKAFTRGVSSTGSPTGGASSAGSFTDKWGDRYPSATVCLINDLGALTLHLRFPTEHRRQIRHSNFIERTFGETRHRVKVIGRLPGETSCLSLAWAVLDGASLGWRGVHHNPKTLRLLQDLRRQLHDPLNPEEVTPQHQAVTHAA